jgi:hypothetical protein
MSYCRWSSMDFKCDLYCYEHCDGTWTTHVASNKVVSPIFPDAPWKLLMKGGVIGRYLFMWWHRLHMWTVGVGIRRPLGLKFDGETFKDDSAEDFKRTLLMLRGAGYKFPDAVLDAVDEEIAAPATTAIS